MTSHSIRAPDTGTRNTSEEFALSKAATIEGVVTPATWDIEQNLSAVAVLSADIHEYAVDDEGRGSELFGLVGERVRVTGRLTGTRLSVDDYEVLES